MKRIRLVIGMSKKEFYKARGRIPPTSEIFDTRGNELAWEDIEFDNEKYASVPIDSALDKVIG